MMRQRSITVAAVAIFFFARAAAADTPPSVWDLAKDPTEHDRWDLHVRVERLLRAPISDDVLPSEQRRDDELRLEAARAMLEQADAATSPDVRLRFDLGVVYERLAVDQSRQELFQRAVDILAPALESAPEHPATTPALEALVEAYAKLDRPRDEIGVSRRYVSRLVDDRARTLTWMNMGEAEMRLGRLEDAIGTFRNVLQVCGALPNSSTRNTTYALTLWDLGVALDRSGEARAGMEAAAQARQLSWDEVGPMGLPHSVTGWDAIRDHQNVFFVPDWEREWYLALGTAVAARAEQDARAAAEIWAVAELHWATYVARAAETGDNKWLAIGRLRQARAHEERARAEQRAAKQPRATERGDSGHVELRF